MDSSSFLCRNAGERQRLLDMNRRLRPAKLGSTALFAVAAVVAVPVYGWRMGLPLLLAIAALAAVQMRIERLHRPEFALAGLWLFAQLAIVLALSFSEGPRVYSLVILVVPMLMAAAAFPARVVAVGTAVTTALMIGAGFGLMEGAIVALPPVLIFPIAVLLEVTLLASGTVGADQAARQSAVVDQLTGLLNRAALQARAAELTCEPRAAGAPQLAVILCDVDHFKMINDDHGHGVGDRVLVEIAHRLSRLVGQSGSVYRYGGEEFIVLVEQDTIDAVALAERIRAAVSGDQVAGLCLTVSLGVAFSRTQSVDWGTLVADADRALYRAKARGRDRTCLAETGGHRAGSLLDVTDEDLVADRRISPAGIGLRRAPVPEPSAQPARPSVPWRSRIQGWTTWTMSEREHMLDVIDRVTRIGKVGDPLALAALLGAGPWLGWAPLIPVIVSIGVMQLVHLLLLPRLKRPEFVALGGVIVAQVGAGLYVVLARHPLLALPLLTILIFPGAAAAPAPAAVAQTLIAAAVMTGAALLVGGNEVFANPTILVLPLALLGAVAMFGYAIGQSTVDHRVVATVDALTGSLSRAALRSRAAELSHGAHAAGEPIALLIADLDHFKAINDEHGHATGDLVLAEVAERLRSGVREFDSIYRIGGEEFVSLLVGLDDSAAAAVAERLRRAVGDRPVRGQQVTISIGVASSPAGSPFDYERLFASADAALLAAKSGGRDRVLTGVALALDGVAPPRGRRLSRRPRP